MGSEGVDQFRNTSGNMHCSAIPLMILTGFFMSTLSMLWKTYCLHALVDGEVLPVSLHDLTRTCHNLTRTCHNLTRTCHDLTRTCHNLTRTCHNLTRTCHDLTRTCHNLTRTCHNLTRISTPRLFPDISQKEKGAVCSMHSSWYSSAVGTHLGWPYLCWSKSSLHFGHGGCGRIQQSACCSWGLQNNRSQLYWIYFCFSAGGYPIFLHDVYVFCCSKCNWFDYP